MIALAALAFVVGWAWARHVRRPEKVTIRIEAMELRRAFVPLGTESTWGTAVKNWHKIGAHVFEPEPPVNCRCEAPDTSEDRRAVEFLIESTKPRGEA